MLLERDRKLFYIFAVISIALSLIVCIPFSLGSLHSFEIIVKYMVIPCAIGLLLCQRCPQDPGGQVCQELPLCCDG